MTADADAGAAVESAVAEGGSYELLRQRLARQGEALAAKVEALNEARLAQFGRSETRLAARLRARTENNCVARDIVRVGELLLFGFNVFIGLRKETRVSDVFALYRLRGDAGAEDLEPVPVDGTFLADPRFAADFRELYAYYKSASLTQLRVSQQKLLAAFRIGQQVHDLRVFRWNIGTEGTLSYIDSRGERDIALPPAHDFEWVATTRDDHVAGRFPHVNILDALFVETIGGDLTVKVEDNTESGLGIYSEPVEDRTQSLVDAEIAYARLGSLILLRIRPYRETDFRYLVYNERTRQVVRMDAIGRSCVQLPEDHGIVFPGGYYLQSGEHKQFDVPAEAVAGLLFERMYRSPNGEDVLYVFYEPGEGNYGLFAYNMIEKTLAPPLLAHGNARFDDGRILVFVSEGTEPTRTHPMQLWQTPFASEDHAAKAPVAQTFLGRVGNPELVRGISELTGLARSVREQTPTRAAYESLIRQATRIADTCFWLDAPETGGIAADLAAVVQASRTTLDEFDKVAAIRREADRLLQLAEQEQRTLLTDIASQLWQEPEAFVRALDRVRVHRGKLAALQEQRHIDVSRLQAMDAAMADEQRRVGERAVRFLAGESAFDSYRKSAARIGNALREAATTAEVAKGLTELDASAHGLDLLTELFGSLPGGDAATRTAILDHISQVYAGVNRLRAEARSRRDSLSRTESAAEFGAQLKLFGQSVENALDFADTPEKTDDGLTRLLAQLEELEGRFGENEAFLSDIAAKREAVYEAFATRRQQLLESRQRRARTLADSAQRILAGAGRRLAQLSDIEAVHTYFAADPLLVKLRDLLAELRAIGANVAADDIDTQFRTARDNAVRAVRDRHDLVADSGHTIRLGRHAFTINRQPLDLTLVPKDGHLAFHLTSTDYFVPAAAPEIEALRAHWDLALVSESPRLYRAEYLAGEMLGAARAGQDGLDRARLAAACQAHATDPAPLAALIRDFVAERYQEGYQKGIHDHDAALLLCALVPMEDASGLLRHGPRGRALALLYWAHRDPVTGEAARLRREARSARQIRELFGAAHAEAALTDRLAGELQGFGPAFGFFLGETEGEALARDAAAYLIEELAHPEPSFVVHGAGQDLAQALVRHLESGGRWSDWKADHGGGVPDAERWHRVRAWVCAFAESRAPEAAPWADDAATALALDLPRTRLNATLESTVTDLLGEHPRIRDRGMALHLNDFHERYADHVRRVAPAFRALQAARTRLVEDEKDRLRLAQFQAKPLSSFVRNRLLDEVYLPIVGDNLARQIGAAGEGNRSDRMGLLLLISPPGYGKTTLMEYVADRLGLIFVRINGPALGHDVRSLDPARAPHSAARQELEKLNLGLAMGSNVMLYVDDIQHTHPEFLQKFISLCDATRRIEGVWNGDARTYDLRGKRFAMVMSGNPYTESGDAFKVPDMLANRADIYNLGDVLSGREALFALSYIENSITANPVLLPLAARDPKDVHRLVRVAQGEEVPASEFAHAYSAAETQELVGLLQRLFRVRDLLLRVNLAYIASAAQDDAYRTEPPFRLQGSYRNMAKLAARVTAIATPEELDALLRDHYRGEAQTLTSGAEENLLRLAELLGSATPEETARWSAIKEEFVRRKRMGGPDTDGATRVARQLTDIALALENLQASVQGADRSAGTSLDKGFGGLSERLEALAAAAGGIRPDDPAAALSATVGRLGDLYERTLLPLVSATYHKMRLDHGIWDNVKAMGEEVERLTALLESVRPQPPRGKGPARGG